MEYNEYLSKCVRPTQEIIDLKKEIVLSLIQNESYFAYLTEKCYVSNLSISDRVNLMADELLENIHKIYRPIFDYINTIS